MDRYGRPYAGGSDWRTEVVSGKRFGSADLPVPAVAPRRTSHTAKPWGFSDPETKRKKRIAKYKVYTVEGRVKATLKKGLRWIKIKCSEIIHGY